MAITQNTEMCSYLTIAWAVPYEKNIAPNIFCLLEFDLIWHSPCNSEVTAHSCILSYCHFLKIHKFYFHLVYSVSSFSFIFN